MSYDILCHCRNFLVTLSMNKFTNIVIKTYFQFVQMPIIKKKWYNLHPNKSMMKFRDG